MELPNKDWLRSPLMPTYALCLDPSAPAFGWKMKQNNAHRSWECVSMMTEDEVIKAIGYESCATHVEQLTKLLTQMQGEKA